MTIAEYNKCVDRYADPVFRFILKNLRDEERAKDVVQDSFAKMWEKVKSINYDKSKSYLFSTAYHTMIDILRRDKFRVDMPAVEHEAQDDMQYSDLKEILDKGLSLMPDKQKSVILLRDYEGYSYKEIGEITGMNESQVKVYIFRARMFLKQYIGSMDMVI